MLSFEVIETKIRGCWMGKNIGGTLGGPFEGTRGVSNVTFYTHDLSLGVLPNDDLDLQLVWLRAAEMYGTCLDSKILSDFWLSHIVPHWSEYGQAKSNLRRGLMPPFSGTYCNPHAKSCGAFIRSEIWACLCPGHPELAVRYAYEDAIVDHAGEGVYGEVFIAALQSAAFVESNILKLIDIALSYIPKDCDIAGAVSIVINCKKKGETWQEARKAVFKKYPSEFGDVRGYENREIEPDLPQRGHAEYDAACNIAFAIIGLLYGKDFGDCICICTNCGEDADCSAATAGATLGIIYGYDRVPTEWIKPIGNEIKTISIDLSLNWMLKIPKTTDELTERVLNLIPVFSREYFHFYNCEDIYLDTVEATEDLYMGNSTLVENALVRFLNKDNCTYEVRNSVLSVMLKYEDGVEVRPNQTVRMTMEVSATTLWQQSALDCEIYLPQGWTSSCGRTFSANCSQVNETAVTRYEFELTSPEVFDKSVYRGGVEIIPAGRANSLFIPLRFLNTPASKTFERFVCK